MSRTPKPLTGLLVMMVLVCPMAVSAGCAGPRPMPAESTPTATSDPRCPALGPLADVCGKVFTSTQIKGGRSNWGDLPALQLTLSTTPDDQTPLRQHQDRRQHHNDSSRRHLRSTEAA